MPQQWTENRKRVFRFLEKYFARYGRSPSLHEIAEGTGLWKRSVEIVLKGLEKMGVIEITPGISRGIRLIGAGEVRVPLLGDVRAGAPALAQEEAPAFISVDRRLVPFDEPVALRVEGYSMKDAGILPGDIILLRRQSSARSGETVVAWYNGGLTVKILSIQGRRVRLLPANPSYKEIEIRQDDEFSVVGRVMLVLRDLGGCFDFRSQSLSA
ncbi:MAG: transcriptional repressor LexA [Bacteroidota bacterium]|nr:transcriptional repressor LexA [Bacteroidota bacterium]